MQRETLNRSKINGKTKNDKNRNASWISMHWSEALAHTHNLSLTLKTVLGNDGQRAMERDAQNKETHPAQSNLFSLNKPAWSFRSLTSMCSKASGFVGKKEAKTSNDLLQCVSCWRDVHMKWPVRRTKGLVLMMKTAVFIRFFFFYLRHATHETGWICLDSRMG